MSEANRRPISQRESSWAKAMARALAKSAITPNQISALSIVLGVLGGGCFAASGLTMGIDRILALLGAALFCQLRLLANMLDGMVAVEAGKGSPDGPIWNEAPDRFSDIAILIGAGYGAAFAGAADVALGWAAAVAAVMTAYARELGRSAGAPADFSGPMAKPHRMFVMTMAALISVFESFGQGRGEVIAAGLWIAAIGASFTTLRRLARAIAFLRRPKS